MRQINEIKWVTALATVEAIFPFTAWEQRSTSSTLLSECCRAHLAASSPVLEWRSQGHSLCSGAWFWQLPALGLWYPLCTGISISFVPCGNSSSIFEENGTDLWEQSHKLHFSGPSSTMGYTFEVTPNSPLHTEEKLKKARAINKVIC